MIKFQQELKQALLFQPGLVHLLEGRVIEVRLVEVRSKTRVISPAAHCVGVGVIKPAVSRSFNRICAYGLSPKITAQDLQIPVRRGQIGRKTFVWMAACISGSLLQPTMCRRLSAAPGGIDRTYETLN